MTRDQLIRLRLNNQQLTHPSFTKPADVVRWFGAIQSQDLPGSLCAIGLRMRHATEDLVERAIASRSIVRSWPMRRTIHCMAAEDARWMIGLLAPRGIDRMKPYHRKMGITDDHLRRAGKVFESALAGDQQLTRAELYRELNASGVRTEAPNGLALGMHLICHWAQAGLICIAARKGKQPTFTLLEGWTPRGRKLSGDDAFAELARLYFQSHGPATVKDFAWWAGLTMKEAQRALLLAADLLKSGTIDGVESWQMRKSPAAPAGPLPVLLLPPFDEYTVAYADRAAVLTSISYGLAANLLISGRIAGTWKRTLLAGDRVAVTFNLLRILNKKEQAGLALAAERYAAFIGKKLVGETPNYLHPRISKGSGQR